MHSVKQPEEKNSVNTTKADTRSHWQALFTLVDLYHACTIQSMSKGILTVVAHYCISKKNTVVHHLKLLINKGSFSISNCWIFLASVGGILVTSFARSIMWIALVMKTRLACKEKREWGLHVCTVTKVTLGEWFKYKWFKDWPDNLLLPSCCIHRLIM